MWQVCPMCKGSGVVLRLEDMTVNSVCPVCQGKMIINELTGLPPLFPQITPPQPYYLQSPTIAPLDCTPIITCEQKDSYNPTEHTGDFWK